MLMCMFHIACFSAVVDLRLCNLHRPIKPILRRWPHLQLLGNFSNVKLDQSDHLKTVEPLTVAAFTSMVLQSSKGDIVMDIGANVGAYSLFASALGRTVISVEMQPGCMKQLRCHMTQVAMPEGTRILNRYVTSLNHQRPIRVPVKDCNAMASPSAVAGRWPHGLLTKATRMLSKESADILQNTTQLVHPINLANYIKHHFPNRLISVVKIDTEGFEIHVLESLRPVWHRICSVVIELQPFAWKYSNVSRAQGLQTLREMMTHNSFIALTLPHSRTGVEQDASVSVHPCSYNITHGQLVQPTTGLETVKAYNAEGVDALVKYMLDHPGYNGWFFDLLLWRADICESSSPLSKI